MGSLQFKDDRPVRQEEEVGEAGSVHPYEDVAPLVLLKLLPEVHLVTVLCLLRGVEGQDSGGRQ